MATLPRLEQGHLVSAQDWNDHVDQINENTTTIADHNASLVGHESRLDALEEKPRIVLRKNADQMIGRTDGDVVISWQVVESGTASMKSGNTVVIPSSGIYFLAANVNLQAVGEAGGTTGGEAILYITRGSGHVSGTSLAAFGQPGQVSGGLGNGLSVSTTRYLNAGDVLQVQVYQNSNVDRPARATDFGGCTFAVSML